MKNIEDKAVEAIHLGTQNHENVSVRHYDYPESSIGIPRSCSNPKSESIFSLFSQSHSLISRYEALKEKIAPIFDFSGCRAGQRMNDLIENGRTKNEEASAVLQDLYAQARTEIMIVVERESKRMRGVAKGMRKVEKETAEYALR